MSKTKRNNDSDDRLWKTQPYRRKKYHLTGIRADYISANEDADLQP